MNNCLEYLELISAYIDSELSETDKLRLDAHLQSCANCFSILEAYRGISVAVGESCVPAPESLRTGVMEKIAGIDTARISANMKKFKLVNVILTRYLPVAACLAFLLLTVPRLLFKSSEPMNMSDSAAMSYMTGAGAAPGMANEAPQASADMENFLGSNVAEEDRDERYEPEPEAPAGTTPGTVASDPAESAGGASRDDGNTDTSETQLDADAEETEIGGDWSGSVAMNVPEDGPNDDTVNIADYEGVYAIIIFTGEMPALLNQFAINAHAGELFFEIPRDAAEALIHELAERDGVVVNRIDGSGEYARVYYTPGD